MLDDIDRIRAFNRFYTRRMGLLANNFAGSGQSVTDLRVLFDIGSGPTSARDIATSLELDEGYLSRLLKRYDAEGWLIRKPSPQDARQKQLSLSKKGRAVLAGLEQASRDHALSRLGDASVGDVVRAMDRVRAAFGQLDPADVTLRDLQPGDLGWAIAQNAAYYNQRLGFNDSFERLLLDIFADFSNSFDPSRECGLIAASGDLRLGSVFCKATDEPDLAKLRVLYVEPWARGLGLGRQLVDACVGFARSAGYKRMTLMTHQSLSVARDLYAAFGFQMTASVAEVQYGVPVVEETWQADL